MRESVRKTRNMRREEEREREGRRGRSEGETRLESLHELDKPVDDFRHGRSLLGVLSPHRFHEVDNVGSPLRAKFVGRRSEETKRKKVSEVFLVREPRRERT